MLPILPNTPPNSLVWRIVHFPLVLLMLGVAAAFVAQLLSGVVNHALPIKTDDRVAVAGAVIVAAIFALVYAGFVRLIERRPRVAELALDGGGRELGIGLLIGVALFSLVVAIIWLAGGYHVVGMRSPAVMLLPLAVAITSGVAEEIVLRGLFFRLLESFLGSWIALALSAALFGAGHLSNPHSSLLAGIAIAFEAGIMLAAFYMVTRRLWAAIGLHAAWNFTQGGIYGIAVSGFEMKGLLVPRIIGPDLLTGGRFGAEASLPAMIVCTLFGITLLAVAYRRGRFVAPFWARARQPAGLQE